MAEAPSYTTVPGRVPELLKKLRETGVPAKATNDWLRSLGFTSSNDRSLVSVLRQIGFIDAQGVPQPAWREYRGADHRAVLGRAIVLGYDMLYSTYPDAHVRNSVDLSHVFGTKTTAGKQAIDKMVSTFKNLAKEADFDVSGGAATTSEASSAAVDKSGRDGARSGSGTALLTTTETRGAVTINVNVQLTIPETTDEKVFEAFFSAMRKHLIDDNAS